MIYTINLVKPFTNKKSQDHDNKKRAVNLNKIKVTCILLYWNYNSIKDVTLQPEKKTLID